MKQTLTPTGYWQNGIYYYYLKDHLGSNREVTSYAGTTGTVVQQTEYYPSGTAYAEGTGAGVQPFKFTGKELILMHGLNWQDFGARWLDNVRMQWTTMDPLAEKYYAISPYAYCNNNPVKLTDSEGKQPDDPLSTGAPAQQQANGTWTMAQASSYIPTPQTLEIKTIPMEDRLKTMRPASSGTITATKSNLQKTLDATADNPMSQLETSPVIQGAAVVSAAAMAGVTLPEVSSVIATASTSITETAVSVTTAVSNSTTLSAIAGVAAGFVNSQLPQDAPQVIANPIFNTFQAGSQAFFVLMQLLNTPNPTRSNPKKNEKHQN